MKNREKIYIIPTAYGLMYASGIFVSLVGGAIYSNNLAFMLCFFLMALFLIGMVQTHSNIKKINIEKITIFPSPSQSSGKGMIFVKSENFEKTNQMNIECVNNDDQIKVNIDTVFENSLHSKSFDFKTGSWGKKRIKKIKLSTRYPFGFFYAWKNFPCSKDYFIYPKPMGQLKLPPAKQGEKDAKNHGKNKGEDFSEHKKYQIGESHKHVDWKAYARCSVLLTKKFHDGDKEFYFIDYNKARGDEDERMAQLSKWVHQCEEKSMIYSLKVKTKQLPMGSGEKHKLHCLKVLASFRESS